MKSFLTISVVITKIILKTLTRSSFFRQHVQCQCSDRGSPYTSYQRYGMIQSPGYPDQYSAYENCEWTLNPPRNIRGSELILLNVQLETHVADPADGSSCYGVDDYVMLGNVKGCDKEGPVCLAFMLNTVTDFGCHHIIREHFPHCHSMIHDRWPFMVSFHTENSFKMRGFQLNYTFIDCNNFQSPPSVFTPMTPKSTATIPTTPTPFVEDVKQQNDTASNAAIIIQRLTTQALPKDMNQTATTTATISRRSTSTLQTKRKDTYSTTRTSSIPLRSTSTLVKSTSTLQAAPIDDNPEEVTKTTNSTLIGIFIALCLIFALLVLTFIFRRRIKACLEKGRCTSERISAPTNNNNSVKKGGDYMIDVDKERFYEAQPTTPHPCSKPCDGIPSISSNLIGENNSTNFQYNHLEHFRYSVASEDGCQNPAYSSLER